MKSRSQGVRTARGLLFHNLDIGEQKPTSRVMRGRKPKNYNVIPIVGDGSMAGRAARAAAVKRAVRRLQPPGLSPDLRKEWTRIATILADPAVDRLKPQFVDVIVEFCRSTVRLRNLRAAFDALAEEKAAATGKPLDPLGAEVYRIKGRNGEQIKTHPYVARINETWSQWRSLAAALGLSPADGRNMIPDQGEQFDESEGEFA